MTWTTPADVAARLRARWDSGHWLRTYARGDAFPGVTVALHGPRAREIGDDVAKVRAWVRALVDGSGEGRRYRIEWAPVGGRAVGRNELPVRAHVESWAQAWALLGKRADVGRYDELLAIAASTPVVHRWVASKPKQALAVGDDLPRLVQAWRWLDAHRGSGAYLREVSAPGVDTKFVERHRGALADMLEVRGSADGFLADLGLQGAPTMVRLRAHLPLPGLGTLSELAVRVDEAAGLALPVRRGVVVENLVTYLSVPVPDDGAVLWGRGFDVASLGQLPWLACAELWYWGDLDAKGFEILDRARAIWPQTRSVLMDEETLLVHKERWVREPRPPAGVLLPHLTADEARVYRALVEDEHGDGVRLEQERIDWAWARARLPR